MRAYVSLRDGIGGIGTMHRFESRLFILNPFFFCGEVETDIPSQLLASVYTKNGLCLLFLPDFVVKKDALHSFHHQDRCRAARQHGQIHRRPRTENSMRPMTLSFKCIRVHSIRLI